jgi:hypothetical protein
LTVSVQLGPDGTAFVLTDPPAGGPPRLFALDRGGRLKSGWPMTAAPGFALVSVAPGPDGSVYVTECGALTVGCLLHRLDGSGMEQPGWPFEVPPKIACEEVVYQSCFVHVNLGSDGTIWLNAYRQDTGGMDLIAIDASGKIKPGWPVDMDDHPGWWSNQQIGPDGTVFVVWRPVGRPIYDEESGVTDDIVELWAFAPDGRPRPSWPVSVPEIGGYLFGPQGTIVVWSLVDLRGELCAAPRRTVFTVLNPDGRTAPGWPRGSTGFSSSPTVDVDGTVYFVTGLGNVYAYDRAGEIKAGWPAAVPGVLNGCDGAAGARLAPDGTIYIVGDELTARSPDGRSHSAGAWFEVVALNPAGQVKPGWPVRLPIDPTTNYGPGLTVLPDGRLFVQSTSVLLSLDPDGSISD